VCSVSKQFDANDRRGFRECLAECPDLQSLSQVETLADFIGALLVNSVERNGHFNLHNDEALRRRSNPGRAMNAAGNELA